MKYQMKTSIGRLIRGTAVLAAFILSACGGGGGGSPPPSSYTIGGTVNGLNGSVVLRNNGGDDLTVTADGSFAFTAPIENGNTYAVTVQTQPTGQTCSVSTGTGTVSGNNVTNVTVICSTNAYIVGGTVNGLTGSVVLQNNSGDNLTLSADGNFSFATAVAYGSPYAVTVLTQPANMSCSVANGTGTMAATDVSNIVINCSVNTYIVGGTVNGLNGNMVLQNNGTDDHTVSVNGPFAFPTAIPYGNPYLVSILSKPASQFCAVSSGSGTVAGNVNDIGVSCSNILGGSIQSSALALSGTVSTFAGRSRAYSDGTGATAQFYGPQGDGVVVGGKLYISDTVNNVIRQIDIVTTTVTTLAGAPYASGSNDGTGMTATFKRPAGLASDGTNLYVADNGNCIIRKIVIATSAVTTLAGTAGGCGATDGTGAAARFNFPNGIATDGTNLYVADTSSQAIRKIVIATGVVTTLAGQANLPGSTDGIGTAASFNSPTGIVRDGANLYVADSGNSTIRKIVIATASVTTLAGQAGVIGSADGTGTAATFGYPRGLASDGTNLYVTELSDHTIRKIAIATAAVTTLAGQVGVAGSANGTGTAATFNAPAGIATDGSKLYVSDSSFDLIRQIDIATAAVSTLAGSPPGTDGIGMAASFNTSIGGITTDGSNLYVVDTGNNTIRKVVIATGAVTTLAGTAGTFGSADGTGAAARFDQPGDITTDGISLYVTEIGNHTIRKIVIATGAVTTLAGGTWGYADGIGTAAMFKSPKGITTDGTNLYVADGSHVIRKIVIATTEVSTLAGTAGATGSVDGTGAAARFYLPIGITTDGTSLYVSEFINSTIRKIVIASGAVTTLAGTAGSPGSVDGTGNAALFNNPYNITTDGSNLYVVDSSNYTVRKIVIATGEVTTLAGQTGVGGWSDGTGAGAMFQWHYGITSDGSSLYVTDSYDYGSVRKIQ